MCFLFLHFQVNKAVSKSNGDIGGYKIVASSEPGQNGQSPKVSGPNAHAQTGEKSTNNSSLGMTIAFAVALTVLLAVVVMVAIVWCRQRRLVIIIIIIIMSSSSFYRPLQLP